MCRVCVSVYSIKNYDFKRFEDGKKQIFRVFFIAVSEKSSPTRVNLSRSSITNRQ